MAELKRFNPENCDIRTQMMFKPWATIAAYKILTLLLASKGKGIYSVRNIGAILGLPKSTVHENLSLLLEKEYITPIGDKFYINTYLEEASDVRPTGQSSAPPDSDVRPDGQECPADRKKVSGSPDRHNNIKLIIKKNNEKEPAPSPDLLNNLIKVGVHVHLTPKSKELVSTRYTSEGLLPKDITRAIEYLDKDFELNKDRRLPIRDNYLELIGWPLDKVLTVRGELKANSKEETPPPVKVPPRTFKTYEKQDAGGRSVIVREYQAQ